MPGISGNGRLLTTTYGNDGGPTSSSVRFWSLPDGTSRGVLKFTRDIFSSQLSPDGRWVSVVLVNPDYGTGDVEIWDARTRRRVKSLPFTGGPASTRFSPNSRLSQSAPAPAARAYGRSRPGSRSRAPSQLMQRGSSRPWSAATVVRSPPSSNSGAVRLWDIPTQQTMGGPLPGVPGESP